MPNTSDDFGEWRIAPDGMAHYVLAGECLCGAKAKNLGGPPERKPGPVPGGMGAIITPLCVECLDRNIDRWRSVGGKPNEAPMRPQRTFWWRQPRRGKR